MMKTNKLSLEEWSALRYPVTLHELSDEEGGGWLATIPLLGEGAFMADGETASEAVSAMERLRRDLYETVINSGQPIPLPVDVTDAVKMPSGKWMMRTLPKFHAELQEAAKASGVSFNAYCNYCLQRGHAVESVSDAVEDLCSSVHGAVNEAAQVTFTQIRYQWQIARNSWGSSEESYDLTSLNAIFGVVAS